jgi:hypothetical protein
MLDSLKFHGGYPNHLSKRSVEESWAASPSAVENVKNGYGIRSALINMADIFLSYSHEDRIKALWLIRALEAQGLTVWWDHDSLPGTQWNQNIARQLKSARCVIVAWSEKARNSSFIREEAGLALAHNTYLPITFDQTGPPSQFHSIEVLDLSRWLGSTDDSNFLLLLAGIERLRGDRRDETGGVSRKVNKNRSRLRVWGITIGGTFYGIASGVIAKPLIAAASAIVISAWIGAYWAIPRVWTGSHYNPAPISEHQYEFAVVLRGHNRDVWSAAFSPDGKLIVTASWDETARIWHAASVKEIAVLRGHDSGVYSAAFSPDGKRIVTASWDHTARIWDAASAKEIAVLRGH